ncbi:MAG: hypothetical protein PSX36_01145 [bacterium]|nr:hypothetical protein [bacterium]
MDNLYNDDRQANSRVGVTAAVPINKRTSIKFSASTGAIVRLGQDYTSYSLGYQYAW